MATPPAKRPRLDNSNNALTETPGRIPVQELRKWKPFHRLFRGNNFFEILKNTRLAYVYGERGILVTVQEDVYITGDCAGLVRVDALSGKKIKEFVSGNGANCFAVLEDGTVYSWGSNNDHGQLGLGESVIAVSPHLGRKVGGSLQGKRVVQLAACRTHVIALTSDNQLHSWGDNARGQIGQNRCRNQAKPELIKSIGKEEQIVSVAVTDNMSFVLTKTGEVLGWGWGWRVRGVVKKNIPQRVEPVGAPVMFKKIVSSGDGKIIALSTDGMVYVLCGLLNKIAFPHGRDSLRHNIVDIAGDSKSRMFAFTTNDGRIYAVNDVFGKTAANLDIPRRRRSASSMDEVFRDYCSHTYRSITPGTVARTTLSLDSTNTNKVDVQKEKKKGQQEHGNQLINNNIKKIKLEPGVLVSRTVPQPSGSQQQQAEMSTKTTMHLSQRSDDSGDSRNDESEDLMNGDIQFLVEDKPIRAHRATLIKLSKHFKQLLENMDEKDAHRTIIIIGTTFAAFSGFIHFLYMDKIAYSASDPEKLLDLMRLARKYDEIGLMKKCESMLSQSITIDNVLQIFRGAVSAKSSELEHVAANFILENRQQLLDTLQPGDLRQLFRKDTKSLAKLVLAILSELR